MMTGRIIFELNMEGHYQIFNATGFGETSEKALGNALRETLEYLIRQVSDGSMYCTCCKKRHLLDYSTIFRSMENIKVKWVGIEKDW